jgi:hypothetical protein
LVVGLDQFDHMTEPLLLVGNRNLHAAHGVNSMHAIRTTYREQRADLKIGCIPNLDAAEGIGASIRLPLAGREGQACHHDETNTQEHLLNIKPPPPSGADFTLEFGGSSACPRH